MGFFASLSKVPSEQLPRVTQSNLGICSQRNFPQLPGADWEFSALAEPGSGRREELFCVQSIKDPAGKGALLGDFQVSAVNWEFFGNRQGGVWDLNFV